VFVPKILAIFDVVAGAAVHVALLHGYMMDFINHRRLMHYG
jgi:hypothetical protein